MSMRFDWRLTGAEKADVDRLKTWRQKLWRLGEIHAGRLYLQSGYSLLESNWRAGRFGELDLICRHRSGLYAFVEVKARRAAPDRALAADAARCFEALAAAFASVNKYKQQKIVTTARLYLSASRLGDVPCRFDVVVLEYALTPGKPILSQTFRPAVFWVKQAFGHRP